MDEADEVYVNQVRVGQTGIPDEGGSYDGTNPWEEERIYPLPDDLLHAGTNVVCVRVCNSSGMGGWYAGPILISALQEMEALSGYKALLMPPPPKGSLQQNPLEPFLSQAQVL